MQGSVAITPSPAMTGNAKFRQKRSLGLSESVLQGMSGHINSSVRSYTSCCLFGPPDGKISSDLVREVEHKNALNFGKRFNFDIVKGEPFPFAKSMKLSSECDGSDEENIQVDGTGTKDNESESYIWSETYSSDYMAKCSKNSVHKHIVGPRRTASLLFAPITSYFDHIFTPSTTSENTQKTPNFCLKSESSPSIPTASPLTKFPGNVHNKSTEKYNTISPQNIGISISVAEKRRNGFISSISHPCRRDHHLNITSAKKPSLAMSHHNFTKYAKRAVKQDVMKKPRKSKITDYFLVRRMKANIQSGRRNK